MKLAIVGSRSFMDYKKLKTSILENYKIETITKIVSGGAKGADYLAELFATEFSISTEIYIPDWSKFGKSAGMIRNKSIIENCDEVIAFWDGKSKGTKNSIDLCIKLKKNLSIVYF